jgi:hypothetical protein
MDEKQTYTMHLDRLTECDVQAILRALAQRREEKRKRSNGQDEEPGDA